MDSRVLVAFATRYGTTQEAAEVVAESIRQSGLDVEVKPLRDVKTLDGYRAVVIGAALYMYRWHKDAIAFLTRFQQALTGVPLAVFAIGPVNPVEKEFADARAQLDKELAQFTWLKPLDIRIFGGKFDPYALRFPHNLVPGMKKLPVTDARDLGAVAAWGRDLAARRPFSAAP